MCSHITSILYPCSSSLLPVDFDIRQHNLCANSNNNYNDDDDEKNIRTRCALCYCVFTTFQTEPMTGVHCDEFTRWFHYNHTVKKETSRLCVRTRTTIVAFLRQHKCCVHFTNEEENFHTKEKEKQSKIKLLLTFFMVSDMVLFMITALKSL